jgi:hypothetical protein
VLLRLPYLAVSSVFTFIRLLPMSAADKDIEIEPEVRSWLELLPGRLYRKVEEYAGALAELGPRTPMPYSRPLRDGVSELRPPWTECRHGSRTGSRKIAGSYY